ncbi:MAG: RadC family protein [Alishewanella aestuarii]
MKYTEQEQEVLRRAELLIYSKARRSPKAFTDPNEVRQYLRIAHEVNEPERESLKALFLDSQHRLIKTETIFYGTVDASPVYPRVVVQKALACNAAAVIFSHNHPSGIAEPSNQDRKITERLKSALELVDIRVLDHFVVGDDNIVGFAERGWL